MRAQQVDHAQGWALDLAEALAMSFNSGSPPNPGRIAAFAIERCLPTTSGFGLNPCYDRLGLPTSRRRPVLSLAGRLDVVSASDPKAGEL